MSGVLHAPQGLTSQLKNRQGSLSPESHRGENSLKKGHSGVKTHSKLRLGILQVPDLWSLLRESSNPR